MLTFALNINRFDSEPCEESSYIAVKLRRDDQTWNQYSTAGIWVARRFEIRRSGATKAREKLRRERYKLLVVLIIRSIVYVMFGDDADSRLKPHVVRPATAEMTGENMNRACILPR